MKLTKRILVAILTVALLLTGVVMFASAEDAERVENIEAILEYHKCKNFLDEDFEPYTIAVGETQFDYNYVSGNCPECGAHFNAEMRKSGRKNVLHYVCPNQSAAEPTCGFDPVKVSDYNIHVEFSEKGDSTAKIGKYIIDENGNQVLQIVNKQADSSIDYSITPKDDNNGTWVKGTSDSMVITFRIKSDNVVFYDTNVNKGFANFDNLPEPKELENGSLFSIYMESTNEAGKSVTHDLFTMDLHDMTDPKFTYMNFDSSFELSTQRYAQKKYEGLTPALNAWYTVTAIVDYNNGQFKLAVTPDGGEAVEFGTFSLGDLKNVGLVKLKIFDGSYAGTATYLDDIKVYEGTFLRHGVDAEEYTVETLKKLDAMAKSADTSVEDKLRIAEVYKELLIPDADGNVLYATTETTPEKDTIDAIIDFGVNKFINDLYSDIFLDYVDGIADITDYYELMEYLSHEYSKYNDLFSDEIFTPEADENDLKELFPGIEDVKAIMDAKASYGKAVADVTNAAIQSESYLNLLKDLDKNNKNYDYMVGYYEALQVFPLKRAEYRYEVLDADSNVLYSTVADGEAVVKALGEAIAAIERDADAFIETVGKMKAADTFRKLYDAYLVAKEQYNDGVINPDLDNDSYIGVNEAIAYYISRLDYIYNRIEESEAFIAFVEDAKSSTYQSTIFAQLENAKVYIDDNTAELHAEAEYPGVADAKAAYNALREKLADNIKNSEAYISAVNKIKDAKDFKSKKAAVEAALALKASGSILGIDGVIEANKALSDAESEIKTLEGYSNTLITAVANAEAAKTLAARREYIYIANSCKDLAEPAVSGVNEAKTKLTAIIAAYDAEVAALNSAFVTVVANANSIGAACAPVGAVYSSAEIVKALVK